MSKQIKVLVVDDSSLVRKIITDILEKDPDITVVDTANNGKSAIFKNKELNPDVITMDIEMPIMDGLEALQEIIATNPKPVIMMSVLTQHGAEATFKALDYGAIDFVPKPSSVLSLSVDDIAAQLVSKVKAYAKFKISAPRIAKKSSREKLVAPKPSLVSSGDEINRVVGIGTSTGGPSALLSVFKELPANFSSSIFIVQHMPEGFTEAFSNRLNRVSQLQVKEAEDKDEVKPGFAYLAPGHSHMYIEGSSKKYIRLSDAQKVSGHRPSIDVLFESLADAYKKDLVAIIMTGMGSDGAKGIKRIRQLGGHTIGQDKETSVVYGMNRVAIENGDVFDIVPLDEIAKKIVEHI